MDRYSQTLSSLPGRGEERECNNNNSIQCIVFFHENDLCFYSDMYLNVKFRTVPVEANHEKFSYIFISKSGRNKHIFPGWFSGSYRQTSKKKVT